MMILKQIETERWRRRRRDEGMDVKEKKEPTSCLLASISSQLGCGIDMMYLYHGQRRAHVARVLGVTDDGGEKMR